MASKYIFMKSELDLFELPPVQTNVLLTEQISYSPLTSLENTSTLDFIIPGNGDTYRNLSSIYLRLVVELDQKPVAAAATKAEGSEAALANAPGVVNNLLHSLFTQCTVSLNNVQVSQINDYNYKAFIENILNYGTDATRTHLESVGWSLDPSNLDSLTGENPALTARKQIFSPGRKVEIMGKLHVDVFNQPRFLPNNIDIKISLQKAKTAFYIMEPAATGQSDVKIVEANIFVDHVHVNPNILLAHDKVLEAGTTAKIPYKKSMIRQYTINAGQYSLSIDNLIIGQLPNLLIFTMIPNDAYSGNRARNPFNFKHYDLQQFCLYVDGRQVPGKPLLFNHGSTNNDASSLQTTRGYNTLFRATGINYFDRGHQITKQLYDNGYFMLAFDLTPDHSYDFNAMSPIRQGTIRIEGAFKQALPEAVTCLIMCEFDALLEIDKLKTVKVTL